MQFRLIVTAALAACVFGMSGTGASAADAPGCKTPGWAPQRLPGYNLDSCEDRNTATVDLNLKPQERTVYGHRNIALFHYAGDIGKSPAATVTRNFYIQQAQKAGAKLASDPKSVDYAALVAKTPKSETWYILEHHGADDTTGAYVLTTLQVLPMVVEGQAQKIKAPLDALAPCGNPPWIAKPLPHFNAPECDTRMWDAVDMPVMGGATKHVEGTRTFTEYRLDDDKNGQPAVAFKADFIAQMKSIGATIMSDPKYLDDVVGMQKTPVGEFWYMAHHYGSDDTTGSYALTTVQVLPVPQFVQLQPMKASLDTQSKQCTDQPWVVKQWPQYKVDSCDSRVRDSMTISVNGADKTLEGPRTSTSYTLTDQKKVVTGLGFQRAFLQGFKAMGAQIMSRPDDTANVVATQKNAAGEFWFIFQRGGGNEEGAGGYTLTTIQIVPFDQEVKVQPMTAALDTLAKCSDPAWLVKQFPQYKVTSCENRAWDIVPIELPTGHQDLTGARTVVTYTNTDDKKVETALTVRKNYAEAFKAIGMPSLSRPDNEDETVSTQKDATGEFWYIYDHGSGNSEGTGTYSLTTVQIVPFPQVVVAQAMPNGLDPQPKPPCVNPTWLVKQFTYFNISQCSWRDFDQITIDLPTGKKTLAGRILVTDFTLSDPNQTPTALYVYKNYVNALTAIGTQLVSDPKDQDHAVWTQTTPQGEFWYMYSKSTGNAESVGSYELTSIQIGGPPPKTCTLEIYGVNFDFNKATLRPDSDTVLKQVLGLFTSDPNYAAEVGGHTDNIGTESYNMKLSGARAEAVKAWLVAHGVAAARLTTHGYGDTKPLVPNTTDANRFKNRRVELKRQNCK